MASEARALLNEQIAELNSLRDKAIRIYTGIAAIPAIVRQGPNTDCIAGHLALLVTDQRADLSSCLDGAEHWLGPTNPVYVPVPGAEGERPLACAGAGDLLQTLAILCQLETGDDGHELPTDFDTLAGELAEKWGNGGIPDWVLSAPVDVLLELAEVARRETDAAIERLTRGFQAATTHAPANDSGEAAGVASTDSDDSETEAKGKKSNGGAIAPGPKVSDEESENRKLVTKLWDEFKKVYKQLDGKKYKRKSYRYAAKWMVDEKEDNEGMGFLTEGLSDPSDYDEIGKRIKKMVRAFKKTPTPRATR